MSSQCYVYRFLKSVTLFIYALFMLCIFSVYIEVSALEFFKLKKKSQFYKLSFLL